MCHHVDGEAELDERRQRFRDQLAAMAWPVLMNHTSGLLDRLLEDQKVQGGVPLPRCVVVFVALALEFAAT